ncbi:MAG TPA: diguanylate cyclase [Vicinamibacteria bacterium]|nr:diguanylate cyclase [Vicinamibacteria bacterium]
MFRPEAGPGSAVADRIVEMLEDGPRTPAGWREVMSCLEAESGPAVYAALLFVLTQLDFPKEKAHEHWLRILLQWEELNRRIAEKVDLRVAVLQYFLRSQRKLHNPAIVEIKILRRTQDSAIYDELTRLYNYRYFQDRAVSEVRRATRYDSALSLLMLDADDFKAYNDSRGHLAGNMALRRLASTLRRAVREVDVVARYGGEEFAILLPSTPKLGALKIGEKLRQAVERAGIGQDGKPGARALTVSVGVASLPGDAASAEELVDRADRALYIAKSIGKNCVKPFSDERREHARLDAVLPGRFRLLERASRSFTTLNLSEGGVLLHCKQPLPTGTLVQLQLALPPGKDPIECAARVLRVVGARGGFEVGTEIVHMPRAHQRRFRSFLKLLKAGPLVPAPAGRRRPRGDRGSRLDDTLPPIPMA